jgi:hypothetical protein
MSFRGHFLFLSEVLFDRYQMDASSRCTKRRRACLSNIKERGEQEAYFHRRTEDKGALVKVENRK